MPWCSSYAGLKSAQDQHGVLDGGLADPHRLEAPLERGILLDHAVLLERGRADQVQVAAGEAGLEDVAGVHRPFAAAAGADDGVHLVDEDDELVLARGDLVHRLGEALLEVAAVAGAGEHRRQVERDDALVAELLGHGARDDRRGEALDDRGLADAGLADEHGVVLRAAAEDLDRLLDLVGAADDRVELAGAGARGEVGAVACRAWGCRMPRHPSRPSVAVAPLGATVSRMPWVRASAVTPARASTWPAGVSWASTSAKNRCSGST